jgi:hypothetical protein
MADATKIGVAGKPTWKSYPRQMLSARATSELCRLIFPDALGGISYTPEEIEDETPSTVKVVRAAPTDKPKKVSRRAPEPVEPSFDEETGEILDAEIVDEAPAIPPVTSGQLTKLGAAFTNAGIKDRDARLAYVTAAIGREVSSSKELDRAEAAAVIDLLDAMAEDVVVIEPDLDDTFPNDPNEETT